MWTGVRLSTGFFVAAASTRNKSATGKAKLYHLVIPSVLVVESGFSLSSHSRTGGFCPSHPTSTRSIRRSARPRWPAEKGAETSSQLAWSVRSTNIHASVRRNCQPPKKRHPRSLSSKRRQRSEAGLAEIRGRLAGIEPVEHRDYRVAN